MSEFGDWFYTLAIYSLLLQLTGRASSVALALVLQVLPQTFIGPAAGVINDRISRKRVMIAADLARMVIVFAMLLVRSRSTVWLVYPLLLLETLMAAFFEPARTVSDSEYHRAGRCAGGQHAFLGDVVGQSADWRVGRRSRSRAVRTRCRVRAQCAFISGVGDADPRDAF